MAPENLTDAPEVPQAETPSAPTGWSIADVNPEEVAAKILAPPEEVTPVAEPAAEQAGAAPVSVLVAKPEPATEPEPAAAPDVQTQINTLMASQVTLTDLMTKFLGMQAQPPAAEPRVPAVPRWQRPIEDSLQTAARAMLGDDADDALVTEYTATLRRQAAVEPYLKHEDAAQAAAAKHEHEQAQGHLRDLSRDAEIASLKRRWAASDEKSAQAKQAAKVSPEVIEQRVAAVLQSPDKLALAMASYPALNKAVAAKAYDVQQLIAGIDFSADVWQQIDDRATLAESIFSRVRFADAPAKPNEPAAPGGGVRVANPAAFGRRNEEVGAPPEPLTSFEPLAAKIARQQAKHRLN